LEHVAGGAREDIWNHWVNWRYAVVRGWVGLLQPTLTASFNFPE
jgi:hypothetical protein